MTHEDVGHLLERIGILRHPCDLDLLVFFARHPRALITSEQLAAWLGYELKQIADSLELLLDGGLLTRTQNPTHAARMYVFAVGGTTGGWLPSLLELASTRRGRLAAIRALSRRTPRGADGPVARRARDVAGASGPRPFVVRRKSDATRNQGGMRRGGL
jgi:hypothetical protein